MDQPISKRESSLRQRLEYLELGIEAEAALEEAIRLLSLGGTAEPESTNLTRLYESLRELDGEWRRLRADLVAFVKGDLPVLPPTHASAKRIRERVELLTSLTPETPPAVILSLAHDIADQWEETRAVSAGVGEHHPSERPAEDALSSRPP